MFSGLATRFKKKTSPFWNVALAVFVLAVFSYFAYSFYTAPEKLVSKIPLPAKDPDVQRSEFLAGLEAKYGSNTLAYYDQQYGFKMKYPIGYVATVDPILGIRLRISAFYPPFSSEIMDVRVVNANELSAQGIRASASLENVSVAEYTQKGHSIYLVSLRQPDPVEENQQVFIRQAYLQCPNYWLVFVGAFSEPLVPDLELADYLIASMEC